jgi:hypothetical protein
MVQEDQNTFVVVRFKVLPSTFDDNAKDKDNNDDYARAPCVDLLYVPGTRFMYVIRNDSNVPLFNVAPAPTAANASDARPYLYVLCNLTSG